MIHRARRRMHLIAASSVLGLACGLAGLSAAPAGAATTAVTTVPGAIRPQMCSPLDYPIRFSPSTTWESPWLIKSANGCQSVWATSGQTFYFQVVGESGNILAENWCVGGTTCQLWNPATNNVPFEVIDYTQTTTSVNIYY